MGTVHILKMVEGTQRTGKHCEVRKYFCSCKVPAKQNNLDQTFKRAPSLAVFKKTAVKTMFQSRQAAPGFLILAAPAQATYKASP